MQEYAVLVPLLPIFGFILTLFLGRKLPGQGSFIPVLAIAGSTIISVGILLEIYPSGEVIHQSWHWFSLINIGILIDPLAAVMLCMVSFVSLIIHIYSIEYMKGQGERYYAETSLFTAGMLGVVIADNLFLFFLSWELVGLCSYLLIGYWYRKPSAASAAKKAFLVTRVGDVLFLAGIFITYANMVKFAPDSQYPLSFLEIFRHITDIPPLQLTLITLLFLGGAAGKSGQFPLHIWLPDAMEGPTTVSALIHAATMVTAGVYLVARTFPMFLAAPHSLVVVAYLGAFTALIAATMGLVMNDIKRVLAYSTISQLGYMMLALGSGAVIGMAAVGIAMLHLISHAFFKALLFLCSGSVIHATHTNDIRLMGGLLSKMKITGYTMLIGSLALAGIPITTGYYSKDAILEAALEYGLGSGDLLPYLMGLFTVLLTAIYIFRAWFMTFVGKSRLPKGEPHESPWLMTVPLIILAFCSLVFAGAVNSWFGGEIFVEYVGRTFERMAGTDPEVLSLMGGYHLMEVHVEHSLLILPLVLAVVGILIAGMLYWAKKPDPESVVSPTNPIYRLLITKYYELPIIDFISMRITMGVAILTKLVERIFIDGSIWIITQAGFLFGEILRMAQSGIVRHYATAIALGTGLLILGLWGWL
ncbi:NADH-quinone oxidoreductase subunit L [Methanosarcinales archaeon]|nr:MAG: NADH-quinone oxidoreductase subunit L [Methanosarcinales archaeon]